jgi:hypothetical protein
LKKNAYVPEGRNERGRVVALTSFSIFDPYDRKNWLLKFGHDMYLQWLQNGKPLKLGCSFLAV